MWGLAGWEHIAMFLGMHRGTFLTLFRLFNFSDSGFCSSHTQKHSLVLGEVYSLFHRFPISKGIMIVYITIVSNLRLVDPQGNTFCQCQHNAVIYNNVKLIKAVKYIAMISTCKEVVAKSLSIYLSYSEASINVRSGTMYISYDSQYTYKWGREILLYRIV